MRIATREKLGAPPEQTLKLTSIDGAHLEREKGSLEISLDTVSVVDRETDWGMAKKEVSGGGGGFNNWLQRVRRTGEYSDVTVRVEGEDFRLHMLPLLNASSYFRNMSGDPHWSSTGWSSSASEDGARVISFPDLPGGAEGFTGAADYCYLLKPLYTPDNVSKIRASAEYLGMSDVLESTKRFLYTTIFSHWRSSLSFLQHYTPTGSTVDEYIETRCLKVLVAALARAFGDTKYLSAPIMGTLPKGTPCQLLSEILVKTGALPDVYVGEALDALVEADVNLNVKCRQGRSVRRWVEGVVDDECETGRARCWVVLCLGRMLCRGANGETRGAGLELASQYWCCLLEQADRLVAEMEEDEDMQEKLLDLKSVLERKIGICLDELDEYLRDYKFGPETLMAIVGYYMDEGVPDPSSFEEIVGDVDRFLWRYAEAGSISPDTFENLVQVFPASARQSHDTIFRSVDKLITTRASLTSEEKQSLWCLVDHGKLSPAVTEKALNHPGYLSQPHILEIVLQQHSEELSKVPETDSQNMRHIMQKVINASLKLLEENSRRSDEIAQLQQQFSALMDGKIATAGTTPHLQTSCDDSPTPCWRPSLTITHRTRSETEGSEGSETASVGTVSSVGAHRWPL